MAKAVQECCAALQALNSEQTSFAVKQKANEFLVAFQSKLEAWKVADEILRRPGLTDQAYFYAANTLRRKLQYDYHELPAASRIGFRDSLLLHLKRHKNNSTVRLRLALCVSALAVHMAGEWKDSLDQMHGLLGNGDTAICFLDILAEAPEECSSHKLDVPNSIRQKATESFRAFAPKVLRILKEYLSKMGDNRDLQRKVFQALHSWIRQGGVNLNNFARDPLLALTFESIYKEQLFEVAVDVLIEIVRSSAEVLKYRELVFTMIKNVTQLQGFFDQLNKEKREDDARLLSYVFAEMSECYLPVVMELRPESKAILQLVLKCTANPFRPISSAMFQFWNLLTQELRLMEDVKQADEYRAQFAPYFVTAIESIRVVMKQPPDFAELDEEGKDRHRRYRNYAADTLLDTAGLLGGDRVLEQITSALHKEVRVLQSNPTEWYGVEACLYCICCIAEAIDFKSSKYVPQILEHLPKLAKSQPLRAACIHIIGRFSPWLKGHPQQLNGILMFVVGGLNDKEVAQSAATAFKDVCESCGPHLSKSVDSLFGILAKSKVLNPPSQLRIIEGIGLVVSTLPKEKLGSYAQKLVLPIATELGNIVKKRQALAKGLSMNGHQEEENVSFVLDKLAEAFRSLKDMHNQDADVVHEVTFHLIKTIFTLLETTMKVYKDDAHRLEKVSRVFKYAIRSANQHFLPLLSQFILMTISHYQAVPHSSLLYLLSICVDLYAKTQATGPLFKKALVDLSQRTFTVLKDNESILHNPDFTEDFFEMCTRYVKRMPDIFFGSPILSSVMTCGLSAMEVQHKEACSAVHQFFALLFTLGVDNPRENARRAADISHGAASAPMKPNAVHCRALTALLQQYGQPLIAGLIRCMAGSVPLSRIPFVTGVAEALLSFCPAEKLPKDWFTEPIKKTPADAEDKNAFLHALITAKDVRTIRQAVFHFADMCNRKLH